MKTTDIAPAGVFAMAALALGAATAHAQQAHTCGWDLPPDAELPATLEQLLARDAAPSERRGEAIADFGKWIRNCDHTAGRNAQMSLRNEQRRTNSTDPVLRALLGFALVRGPDVHVMRAEGALLRPVNRHTNAEIEGVRLLSAVARETGWPEVVEELAAVAVATGKSESLKVSAQAIAAVPDTARDASYWEALAEVQLARDDTEAAGAAAMRVERRTSRAARALGIARMLSDREPYAGARIYLEGLAHATAQDGLQRYFDDLRLLLDDGELAEWKNLKEGHAAWILRKWEWRALLSGIRVEERLAENQRRLAHALKNFRRTSYRGAAVPTAIWPDSMAPEPELLDDRGMIYLRHGAPTHEIRMAPADRRDRNQPVEAQRIAWTYSRPGPIQPVFEFDRGPDRPDYFLAEPYPICDGQHVVTQRRTNPGYPTPGDMMDWATRLNAFDPSLSAHYRRCDRGIDYAQLNYGFLLAEARRHGQELLNSENAAPRLKHPLTASMNLYAFRARGATELVSYIAVHAGELTPASARVPLAYAFRILFAAGDPATEMVVRRDTVIAFTRTTPLPVGAVVGTAIPLRLRPADEARITLSVINGYELEQGQVLAASRTIPSFGDSALALSDIVIAEPRDGAWVRGASRLAPAQGHALMERSPFRLYYEMYNVRSGDPLDVRVVVAPGQDESLLARLSSLIASRSALAVDFAEEAVPDADGVLRADREITADLQPGLYIVTVTVRNGRNGAAVTRATKLVIVGS